MPDRRERPRMPIRVPSYISIVDDESYDLIERLDPDMLVPLDLPSDVPFKPRYSEVKVQPFLRAMLKCAPPSPGKTYVQRCIGDTYGEPKKLQRLAGIWFNRIILLARALYMPARPSDNVEIIPDSATLLKEKTFRDQLRERDGWKTTVTRRAGTRSPEEKKTTSSALPMHIIPPVRSVRKEQDEAFSWELLRQLSGIDPREIMGDNAYRLSNGLLGDKDENSLFNMLAWYLEPELDVNNAPIPQHYIFRRILNFNSTIQQDKTPVNLRNRADAKRTEDLPDPRYLALHAAIGGILIKSGSIFYVIRLFEEWRNTRTLDPSGSSNVVQLFMSHSIGKLLTV